MHPTLQKLYLKLFKASNFAQKKPDPANPGFVLPTFVILGLMMTVAGLTMIARSNESQTTAALKKQSAQSLAVTEAGVTELMQFLNKARPLADDDLSNWGTEYAEVVAICTDSFADSAGEDYVNQNWIPTNNGQDRFRVLDYNYTADDPTHINSPGVGVLTIEGQANFNGNPATSVVEVKIPVSPQTSTTPGLFVTEANLTNNQITGNLLMYGCDIPTDDVDLTNITGTATANPFAEFPSLPEPPSSGSTGFYTLSTGISGNETFPRGSDVPDSNGTYHYLIGKTDADNSIKLNGNETITITPGNKVTFYLEGNISQGGSTAIIHDCGTLPGCEPTNFQIYGGNGVASTYNTGKTTEICLSGNSTIDGFIFAPSANVAVNGSGSGDGITGSVWADKWNKGSCGSNTGQNLITQNADWGDLPIAAPRKIAAANSWQRQTAN